MCMSGSSQARGADEPAALLVGFLERHCADCHSGSAPEAGFAVDPFRDEASVLAGRGRWRSIGNRVARGEMPPPDAEQPSDVERAAFLDAARGLFARVDAGPPDPGPAVLRRLNRAEYDATVRHLLQTDFRMGSSFPADGVGYGFANIADVLTVSPLLMERYLDAAEGIAAQAVPLGTAKRPIQRRKGCRCEPEVPGERDTKFRPICGADEDPARSGPIGFSVAIDPDGTFIVRARLYATSPDETPVQAALLIDGDRLESRSTDPSPVAISGPEPRANRSRRIVAVATIKARSPEDAEVIEARLERRAGVQRIAIGAVVAPTAKEEQPTLHVEWLEAEGPADARHPATRALGIGDGESGDSVRTREILAAFTRRAWRGQEDQEAVDAVCGIVDDAVAAGDPWPVGMRRAVAAVLASPRFVFRLESPPPPDSTAAVPVPEAELATRLSYFLWGACPDDRLLALAAEGLLAANLHAEVDRMLDDPRAIALVDQFAMQWLGLDRMVAHGVDAESFPLWRPQLASDMLEETRRFVAEIMRSDQSLLDLLVADFTWANGSLAALYRLDVKPRLAPGEWRRVSLAGTERRGLLGQAAVLTVTSNPTRTSPVKRGRWVMEQILGEQPAAAPPEVPSIDDAERRQLTGTFREKMEQHRADPSCAGCHTRMDAFGFALERFDAIGQWRDEDEAGVTIDDSGMLPAETLRGPTGLTAHLLARRADFIHCIAEKMLIYALGRGLEPCDESALASIERRVENGNFRFRALVHAVVESVPFRLRRGAAQERAAEFRPVTPPRG